MKGWYFTGFHLEILITISCLNINTIRTVILPSDLDCEEYIFALNVASWNKLKSRCPSSIVLPVIKTLRIFSSFTNLLKSVPHPWCWKKNIEIWPVHSGFFVAYKLVIQFKTIKICYLIKVDPTKGKIIYYNVLECIMNFDIFFHWDDFLHILEPQRLKISVCWLS